MIYIRILPWNESEFAFAISGFVLLESFFGFATYPKEDHLGYRLLFQQF